MLMFMLVCLVVVVVLVGAAVRSAYKAELEGERALRAVRKSARTFDARTAARRVF